jgi:enoyl-CoA hydratase
MASLVNHSLDGPVATITLDDGKVNVLSPAMQAAVHDALDRAEADGSVVVLAGREGIFSAGFDLGILGGAGEDGTAMVLGGFELAARLLAFPTPVVIACTGHAVAMGAFLLLSGDYRVGAAGPYTLRANEVAIGMTVPHVAVEVLRQRLTPAAFVRAATLAEPFAPDAAAVAAGFLDRVVDPRDVLLMAQDAAAALATLDLAAHAATKQRVREPALAAVRSAIERDRVEWSAAVAS